MKFSLLAFAIFSTTVFAIGTSELSGSFEVLAKENKVQKDALIENSAPAQSEGKFRFPSSVGQKNKRSSSHVAKLTGNFE